MWFPIFLDSKNFSHVSGYVSMLFDIGGTIGAYFIGYLQGKTFQMEHSLNQNIHPLKKYFLEYKYLLITFLIILQLGLFIIVQRSFVTYALLTFFTGLTLSGAFNVISGHNMFVVAQRHIMFTDMLLNMNVCIGSAMIGLVQVVTAFLLKRGESHNSS